MLNEDTKTYCQEDSSYIYHPFMLKMTFLLLLFFIIVQLQQMFIFRLLKLNFDGA